ncbi:MAG: hypothetical protein IJ054_03375, partial [Lachnospiraceae bacterium]|nr:hypothetical protein [Lachnospiraceae bacterium]
MKFFSDKKDGISLKLFVAAVIIIICAASIGVYAFLSRKIYYTQYKSNIINDVKEHTDSIADTFLNRDAENYDDNEENDNVDNDVRLDSEIEVLASVYGGRIMVVDSDYKIIKDSLGEREGSFIISEKTIEAMTGDGKSVIVEKKGYIQYIRQITDSEGLVRGLIIVHISDDMMNEINELVSDKLVIVFAIILLLCILIAYYISSFSVKDLRYMNNQMDIAQNGHLDEPIKERG